MLFVGTNEMAKFDRCAIIDIDICLCALITRREYPLKLDSVFWKRIKCYDKEKELQ